MRVILLKVARRAAKMLMRLSVTIWSSDDNWTRSSSGPVREKSKGGYNSWIWAQIKWVSCHAKRKTAKNSKLFVEIRLPLAVPC